MGEEVTVNGPTGLVAALRLGRVALPILVLALGLGVPGRSAAQGSPPDPDLVQFAGAYTAAWNAHDLPAVLAFFAPDAVVRARSGDVPPAVWDTPDPHIVATYLEDSHDGDNYDTGGLTWAMGPQQIAAWAAERFARHQHLVTAQPRATGSTVEWQYRDLSDPFQRTPGVDPLEGTAEAVVRGGRITRLTLVLSPASVRRQRAQVAEAFDRAMATRLAAPFTDEPGVRPRGAQRGDPVTAPADAAWPLALAGLASLVAVTARRRRRAPPNSPNSADT
jgi:MYXO-CTERM domain-containing protein